MGKRYSESLQHSGIVKLKLLHVLMVTSLYLHNEVINMTIAVKNYITKYKDELDNLEVFFENIYRRTELNNGDIHQLCAYFDRAGIEYKNARFKVLDKVISENIEEFGLCSKDPGVVSIPILDFIAAYFNNFLGLTTGFIRDYILENAERWDTIVQLYVDENNIPIIERLH